MNLGASVEYIKGIGPTRAKCLKVLGIHTIEDILYHFPKRYEDRSNILPISKLTVGNFHTIKGRIFKINFIRTKARLTIFKLAVSDGTAVIEAVWFNQPFLRTVFKMADELILYGKVEKYKNLQVTSPEYEIIEKENADETIHTNRITPIYPLTKNISQRLLRALIKNTIDLYANQKTDILPRDIKIKNKLIDLTAAIKNIHFPPAFIALNDARRRLVFDEFFILQLGLAHTAKSLEETEGIAHIADDGIINEFKDILPFKPTTSQLRVMHELEEDMKSPSPMSRLLQGDVGSGKTVIAAYGLMLTIKNGRQGALMAPTEVLAQQHYVSLTNLLAPIGISAVLLISGIDEKARHDAYEKIENGQANLIIGTHALIQEKVKFKNLGLVVVDEQHKFGVLQRAKLQEKGLNPDMLIMTATPIPRTLALTIYGDMDVSTLDELPKGRFPIKTYWVGEEKRDGMYNFIRQEVTAGRQAFIVYPVIYKAKQPHIKAATIMYNKLKDEIFSDLSVGLVHGGMNIENKKKVMVDFKAGIIDILVATTVIEVGIDVPNASVMVIEHADKFGLSQLHQLRGRIGRGPYESFCVLVSDGKTEESRSRLNKLTSTQDGFKISEADLGLRGPGQFFGIRQHGLAQIRIGDVIKDVKIMEMARYEARNLLKNDPGLAVEGHRQILGIFKERFEENSELAKVG